MNTVGNAFLLTAAATLTTLGVAAIAGDFLVGAGEIVLGLIVFVVYEKIPVSK